jgi:hypothetical protein
MASYDNSTYTNTKENSNLLWNQRVCYHVYSSPLLVPVLSRISPFRAPSYCLKIHFNIIFPSMPRPSKSQFQILYAPILPYTGLYIVYKKTEGQTQYCIKTCFTSFIIQVIIIIIIIIIFWDRGKQSNRLSTPTSKRKILKR